MKKDGENQIRKQDIEVTRDGNLVYTYYKDNSINLFSDGQIQPLLKLQGWKPYGLCRSTFDDQLVIMDNNDGKKLKCTLLLLHGKTMYSVGRSRSIS